MKLRTVLTVLTATALLPLGALATIHDVGLLSEHPLARLSIVLGKSMTPTLKQGEGLIFVRARWRPAISSSPKPTMAINW